MLVKIAVALCTYNGERFLAHQLATVAAQTRLPDELVVCDDSPSATSATLARQCGESACFPVRVETNSATLGSTPNFERAVRLCQGDIIAFADQDDVWLPHKLAVTEKALRDNP